jgi:hypothetical protein
VQTAGDYRVFVTDGFCSIYGNISVGVSPPTPGSNNFCQGAGTAIANASGNNLLWYATQIGGVGLPSPPVVSLSTPGSTTYYVSQTIGTCESDRTAVVVNVIPAPQGASATYNSPVCTGEDFQVSFTACPACTVVTNGPNAFTQTQNFVVPNVSSADTGWYIYTTTQSGCASMPDTIHLIVGSCADSVWPGDANYDLIVDNLDALYLAQNYSSTGYTRPNASNSFTGQACVDWPLTNNVNLKHADCNGDGSIDIDDTLAIFQNYGLVHLKGNHEPRAKVTALPDLYFDLTGLNFVPGSTVSIPVKLGTASYPMNDLLGMAAQIKIDGITLSQPLTLTHAVTWLGTNTLSFKKAVNNNQLDIAYARIDHQQASGSGTIGTIQLSIPLTATGNAILYFENVTMVDASGNTLTGYNVIDDTVAIASVGIASLPVLNFAVVSPNPSIGAANVVYSLSAAKQVRITVSGITGKLLWQQTQTGRAGEHSVELPAEMASGVYQVRLEAGGDAPVVLKWLKQ